MKRGEPKTRWTEEETALLRKLWVTPGVSRRQVAEAIGRTEKATKARAEGLRLPMGPAMVAMGEWSADQIAELRRLAPTGLGKKGIARKMGVSYSQVRHAARRYHVTVAVGSNAHLSKTGKAPKRAKPRTWSYSNEDRERSRREAAERRRQAHDKDALKIASLPLPPHQEPRGCRWIDGAGTAWRFCQATPSHPGASWCLHHRRIVSAPVFQPASEAA